MKQGFHVCLYKRKGNPIITAYVQGGEGEIAIPLEDFKTEMVKELKARLKDELVNEIGSVRWIFFDETFVRNLDKALEKKFPELVDTAFDSIVMNVKAGAVTIV